MAAAQQTPNFILGLGAQKAGTTWLFDYLDAHPQCRMGPYKEMNFFKAPGEKADGRKRRMKQPAWRMSQRLEGDRDGRIAAELDAQLIRVRPSHYAEIYHRLAAETPQAKLIGDLSPKYAVLRRPELRQMKDYLDSMGYPVKLVLLLRDPVRRCFSAARMAERGQGAVGRKAARGKVGLPNFSGEQLLDFAQLPSCQARTRYERIIKRIEQVFDPSQIFYGIYEDFFTQPEVDRLCSFLEIDPCPARFEQRPHADNKQQDLPAASAGVRDLYAETYEFCRARFGAERIDALWTA